EVVGPSLMDMGETLVCPDPEAPLAIAEQVVDTNRFRGARNRVQLGLAADEPANSLLGAHQQRAVVGLLERSKAVELARHGVEFRWIRLPSPQAVLHPHPKPASRVFIQADHSGTQPTVCSLAADTAFPNLAESSSRNADRADPHQTRTVLEETMNILSVQLRVPCELALPPAGQSLRRANPQSAIARAEQTPDRARGKRLTRGRLPGHGLDAIDPSQPEFGPQPEIAVGSLGHRTDGALDKTFAAFPSRVRVLADVERGIERKRTRRAAAQEQAQNDARRPKGSCAGLHEFVPVRRAKNRNRLRARGAAYAAAAGTVSATSVPSRASLQTSRLPPMTPARSRIPRNPKCPGRSSSSLVRSMPLASSRTATRSSRSS